MKILFCIYQLDFADHIALAYLSAVAKQRGHQTFLCILHTDHLAEKVAFIQPEVVAYSANIWGFKEMIKAHKEVSQTHRFVSILGGPQATFSPETFAESGMDAYCMGEGEWAFRDFLACLENGKPFDDVENLITARKSNPVRPVINPLDDLPFPDRDLTLSNSFLKDTLKKTFYATRGCPYRCNYCCNNLLHELYKGKGPLVRRFSVERVIQEMEYVKARYKMVFVKMGDDLFAPRADAWLEEFTDKYPRRIGLPFNCFLRFDIVDDALLVLLKKAGCYSVHLSVDSASDDIRERILGRQMKKVAVVEKLKLIRSYGINTWVNYMLAAPESTLKDDLNTISMSRKGQVTYPAFSTTVPMKGTALYAYCAKHGLIDPATFVGDMSGCNRPSELACFSRKEKKIRFNIYLLGAIIARLPSPLYQLAIWLINIVPPNKWFLKLRQKYYLYNIENNIFRLHSA
ncbi:MAG: B12-binding domain-containing radical SAM protein [Verrucomicrobia bacterium]|nr:B12-binding domain-containing radical SAM protein [Verrucomicrobiota bacterium]MBU1735453.1 B12-binding domain-containing radical SAM protein [Verrucomicrobiota bacterium]MBU1856848.1 B12-binding domain-containing radical SAM protein [Verrucomicrobiota bacterium]